MTGGVYTGRGFPRSEPALEDGADERESWSSGQFWHGLTRVPWWMRAVSSREP